jgi:hypothetical protein
LKKSEIIERFEGLYPDLAGEKAVRTVTFAISGLQANTNQIKGYKPIGLRMKGNYWTLTEWWEGAKLKNEYKARIS